VTTGPADSTEHPQGRRAQILATAAELFAQRGFHGVSIDDIGAAVGISGPGLYRHFPSKDAMLGQMLVGISRRLLATAQARVGATAGPAESLTALVDWHVEFALENPALITIQGRDLQSLNETDRRRVRRLQRQYVEFWVRTLRAVLPAADEPTARAATHATFGLINSTPHSARLGGPAMAALLRRMATAALLATG
jgi:AcrR family transcriptional regulator